jgi:hypothetical protein
MRELDKKTLIGASCILCGVLYFLKELNIFCSDWLLLDPKMYPIYLAVIFFYGKQKEFFIVSAVVSIIVWFDSFINLMEGYTNLIWPIAIVIIGVLLLFSSKGFKKNNRKEDTIEDATIIEDDESDEK